MSKDWLIKLTIGAALVLAALIYGLFKNNSAIVLPRTVSTEKPAARESVIITKVLDGDTVVVQGGDHVRLLGIDADESGYPCYRAAKIRLEELVLGKTAELEKDSEDLDQYGRKLRYVFLNGENINKKMIVEGLAIARFYPENQKYKDEIVAAETEAIKNTTGCKWSD
jgi:micrococcal nuclease